MTIHCMIDIETMGNGPRSAILSVGAVNFHIETGEIVETFYAAADMEDAIRYGSVDGSTVKWWMQQSDAARQSAVAGTMPLREVLSKLASFYRQKSPVWGNGPAFDMVILENAYNAVFEKAAPWKFWDHLDCRTMKSVGECFGYTVPAIKGVAHNALDDAKHQAKWVSEIFRLVRSVKSQLASDDI